MSIWSRLTGSDRFFTLAEGFKSGSTSPNPMTTKVTPTINRINPVQLEALYLESPLAFNIINKTVQIIKSASPTLVGDQKSVKFFQNFLDNIGYRGGEEDWDSILENIFRFQCIYGRSPGELIYNTDGDEIVDLTMIDPTRFDYAKRAQGLLALDKFGNPLGYTQALPFDVPAENKIPTPEGVTLLGNQIFLPPERVFHFKLYTIGDGFYGIGLLESIYPTFQRHKASEKGFAEAAYHVGNPIIEGIAGDINHTPTADIIDKMTKELENMTSTNVFAHAYYHQMKIIEAKVPDKMEGFLNYWIDMMVTGTGMAKAFATGAGEETNRSTLARQEYLMKLTLRDIVNRTTKGIETQIFRRIALVHNQKYPNDQIRPVKLKWGEIALEEMDSKAVRMSALAKTGLLTPSAGINKWIREVENLPQD